MNIEYYNNKPMLNKSDFIYVLLFLVFMAGSNIIAQKSEDKCAMAKDNILKVLNRVNNHFLANEWKNNDRNWIRGTYYSGLMAFYEVTGDEQLFDQAKTWAMKHGWRTGTEWMSPANRLTCSQTYLQLYFKEPNIAYIERTRSFMDKRIENPEPASEQGWDYVDALYVGIPAYLMMTKATGEFKYADYANRIFWEVKTDLYDEEYHLFYRDEKAKTEKSANGKKVLWSRGNGWAIASIPHILEYLPEENKYYSQYLELFKQMAEALLNCQDEDGFWRTNLADPEDFTDPESSGTAFFTFAMAWGINNQLLDKGRYLPVVEKAWHALYNAVDENGKVCYGQSVSRDPGHVDKNDSHEFVAGAFLLAGSEVFRLSAI